MSEGAKPKPQNTKTPAASKPKQDPVYNNQIKDTQPAQKKNHGETGWQ